MSLTITSNSRTPCLSKVDRFLDHVPFVSTLTNLITLIAKAVFCLFACCGKEFKASCVRHIQEKSLAETILLCIPLFNIYICLVRNDPPIELVQERSHDKF